ncbi:MAG: hypothetical protein J2P36_10025 [Ktedonobacteraceae bacterium]|nr:hypothetical protein [Ktedonobacteraceae bacterium]
MLRIEELTAINERQRIARDLHDTLVQGTVGLIMQLEVVLAQLRQQRTARAQETLQQSVEAARNSLPDARCAIGHLREEHLCPDDLVEIIQEEVQRLTTTMPITCQADLAALTSIPLHCANISGAL